MCPIFSACWCLLGLLAVYGIQPMAAAAADALPGWFLPSAGLALAADGAVTVRLLRKTGSTDALCWYRRLALPILPNFKSNLKN